MYNLLNIFGVVVEEVVKGLEPRLVGFFLVTHLGVGEDVRQEIRTYGTTFLSSPKP